MHQARRRPSTLWPGDFWFAHVSVPKQDSEREELQSGYIDVVGWRRPDGTDGWLADGVYAVMVVSPWLIFRPHHWCVNHVLLTFTSLFPTVISDEFVVEPVVGRFIADVLERRSRFGRML